MCSGESKGMCCSNGKVRLDPIQSTPFPLNTLLQGETNDSKHFMDKICQYNSIFSMTSFGATKIEGDHFMPTFKIRGIIYHCIGSLLPIGKDEPQFMQMYFTGKVIVLLLFT